MLNQLILVGRVVNDPTEAKTKDESGSIDLTLEVRRERPNPETGENETDLITVEISGGLVKSTLKFIGAGTILATKCRLRTTEVKLENGETLFYGKPVAEKLTFLGSNAEPDETLAS